MHGEIYYLDGEVLVSVDGDTRGKGVRWGLEEVSQSNTLSGLCEKRRLIY